MKFYKIRNKETGLYLQSLKYTYSLNGNSGKVKIRWTKSGRTMINQFSFDQSLRNILRKHSLNELQNCELIEFEVNESKVMPVISGIKEKYLGNALGGVEARDLVKLKQSGMLPGKEKKDESV